MNVRQVGSFIDWSELLNVHHKEKQTQKKIFTTASNSNKIIKVKILYSTLDHLLRFSVVAVVVVVLRPLFSQLYFLGATDTSVPAVGLVLRFLGHCVAS